MDVLAEILREQRILMREVMAEHRQMRKEMGEAARRQWAFMDVLWAGEQMEEDIVRVVEPLLGLNPSPEHVAMSFVDIGKEMGISPCRAQQLCENGLRKIQAHPEICKRMLELIAMRNSMKGDYVYPLYQDTSREVCKDTAAQQD